MAETDFPLLDGCGRKFVTTKDRARFLDAVREDRSPRALLRNLCGS